MEGRLLPDIVVQESVTILQLFPDGNQTLLVRGWFSIVSERLDLQRDRLANEEGLCNPRKDGERGEGSTPSGYFSAGERDHPPVVS